MKHKSAEEIINEKYPEGCPANFSFNECVKFMEACCSQEVEGLPTKEEMIGITYRYLHGVKFDSERERKNAFTDYIKGLEEGIQLASAIIAKKEEEIKRLNELNIKDCAFHSKRENELISETTILRAEKEELNEKLLKSYSDWNKSATELHEQMSNLRNENEQLKDKCENYAKIVYDLQHPSNH